MDRNHRPEPMRGGLAGLAAGLVASLAMDMAQTAFSRLMPSQGGDGEPATEKTADRVSQEVRGHPVVDDRKPLAGQAVHYGFGSLLGIAYGISAEYQPKATAGGGLLFGLSSALLFDEAAVPATGLSGAPWKVAAVNTPLLGRFSPCVRRRRGSDPQAGPHQDPEVISTYSDWPKTLD